jgi:CRISPR/Cas system-associated protein Cas10 (large subunit of type III CRISPR-Cas system)
MRRGILRVGGNSGHKYKRSTCWNTRKKNGMVCFSIIYAGGSDVMKVLSDLLWDTVLCC